MVRCHLFKSSERLMHSERGARTLSRPCYASSFLTKCQQTCAQPQARRANQSYPVRDVCSRRSSDQRPRREDCQRQAIYLGTLPLDRAVLLFALRSQSREMGHRSLGSSASPACHSSRSIPRDEARREPIGRDRKTHPSTCRHS